MVDLCVVDLCEVDLGRVVDLCNGRPVYVVNLVRKAYWARINGRLATRVDFSARH